MQSKHASACDRNVGHSGGIEYAWTSVSCPCLEFPWTWLPPLRTTRRPMSVLWVLLKGLQRLYRRKKWRKESNQFSNISISGSSVGLFLDTISIWKVTNARIIGIQSTITPTPKEVNKKASSSISANEVLPSFSIDIANIGPILRIREDIRGMVGRW